MANFKASGLNNVEEVDVKPVVVDSAERAAEVEFLKKATPDELKKMFREYREGDKGKNINMTEEEAQRLSDCMGKEEFMGLFRDYIDDISDPKNQEEYDQYLRQLEEEGEIPEGDEIIRPTAGFVVKTKSVDVGSKIFVNICGTPKVPKPSQGARPAGYETTGSMGDGAKTGAFWSIPYIHTSMRMDRDKDNKPCHVYDILFNNETIALSESEGPRFKALVVQTALESIEENGKVKLRNADGKFDFSIMQKMTYKGQVIRPHKLKKDVLAQPQAPSSHAAKQQPQPAAAKPAKKKVDQDDPTKPKMTVVHRGEIDMGDFMKAAGARDLPLSRRPKELVIKLELPLMQSAADMQLDIKGGFLEFSADQAGYKLKHKLPFPVNEETGDAKYVKAQKLLTITLEVLPWKPEELEQEISRARSQQQAEDEAARAREQEAARKAEQEAKRLVKKGFLDAAKGKREGNGSGSGATSGEPSESSQQQPMLATPSVQAPDKAKIQDLGECAVGDAGLRAAEVIEDRDGGEPFIQFRQNQKNVTAVVRVAGIEPASVVVDVLPTRVVLSFSALVAKQGEGACGGRERWRYAHTVHLSGDVDPLNSRFDVAPTNLVLVLRKVNETRWDTFTGAPRDPPAQEGCGQATARGAAKADSHQAPRSEPPAQVAAGDEPAASKHVTFDAELASFKGSSEVEGEGARESGVREAEAKREAGGAGGGECDAGRRVVGANGELFEEADTFAGSRPNMVFKTGAYGLGYYTDKPMHLRPKVIAEEAEAEAPTTLAPEPAPKAAIPPPAAGGTEGKPMPKLPFNNTLLYDLD